MTRQRWWSPEHRSSSPDNGVDALAELTGLHLGSLHATACEVARPSGALVRELGALGYPAHLPQATRARCPLPGPDFHRRVPKYPRHTVRYLSSVGGTRRKSSLVVEQSKETEEAPSPLTSGGLQPVC